jgi:hypothetical protein
MRSSRPIGILRLLVPILVRPRRPGGRGLVPLIWRSRRARAPRPFPRLVGRPNCLSLHFGIGLRLIWASRAAAGAAAGAATERSLERIVREAFRDASPPFSGPGSTARRLPALIRPYRLSCRGAAPAGGAGAGRGAPFHSWQVGATAAAARRGPTASRAGEDPAPSRRRQAARTYADRPALAVQPAAPLPTGHSGAMRFAPGVLPSRRPRMLPLARAESEIARWPARIDRTIRLWRGAEAPARPPFFEPTIGARPRFGADPEVARPGAILVWRDSAGRDAPRPSLAALAPRPSLAAWPGLSVSPRARTEMVWREPAAAETRAESGSQVWPSPSPASGSDTVVHSPQASAPAVPMPLPAPDVGRLVDEVVRRLERIGRDERLRRGL